MTKYLLAIWMLSTLGTLSASPWISHCEQNDRRANCGEWIVGGYYSVSPAGSWFAGISGGAEYFFLADFSLGASISPGFGEGYFYLAPSVEANYYLWHNARWEVILGYSFRYFYEWPLRKGGGESDGTFHGPGISWLYGVNKHLYAGVNVSYQWVRFGEESYREWYLTLPAFWVF